MFKVLMALTMTLAACTTVTAQSGPAGYTAGNANRLAVANGTSHTIIPDGFTRIAGLQQPGNILKSDPVSDAVPDILWSGNFGGPAVDECYSVRQTSDGGYVLVGRSNSYGAGNFDGWMVKTDETGAEVWSKTFGDTYIDETYMVRELSAGGYIIAGMSTQFGWAGEGWLIKTDASGNIVWSKGFHPSEGSSSVAWDYLYDVVEMPDGGFVAAGTATDNEMSTQGWIMRVDADGTMLWDHTYGGEYWERFFTLATTSDGGFVAAGDRHWTYDSISWRHDGWLLKFDNLGDTAWTQHFGSEGHDIFRSVKQTSDGGYILAGERQQTVESGFYGWLLKTDANGQALLNKTLSTGGLFAVSQVTNGYFVAAGTIVQPGIACDGWMLKADGSGTIAWETTLPGTDLDDMCLAMEQTSDGGYVMGGKFNSDGVDCDYWLVKTDAEPLEPLTYFYENYDAVTTPALPEGWTGVVEKLLSNTIAEVKTMEQGSTTSLPNAVFIMNGLDGSNGQIDTTAWVALVTPWVLVGNSGATLTFRATGGNAVQVGTLSDPLDPSTFSLVQEVTIDYNFNEYTVAFMTPGTTWIALKHANTSGVTPLFVDDAEFKQIINVGIPGTTQSTMNVYPNPASGIITIETPAAVQSLDVYNLMGAQVFSTGAKSAEKLTLDVSGYTPGTYVILLVTADGNVISRKLTVVR
jgi:hypothetical protein